MMLIPRDELLLAVVEGNVLFWCGVMLLAGLYHAVSEAVSFTWKAYKDRRNERRLDRRKREIDRARVINEAKRRGNICHESFLR